MASFLEKGGLKILSLSRMPGMKRVTAALVVMTLFATSAAAETPVAEVSQLQLYSSFWQNLHHFLYVSAWFGCLDGARRKGHVGPRRHRI